MRSAGTGLQRSPISIERGSAGRKRWSDSSTSESSSTASRKLSNIVAARRRSCCRTTSESGGEPYGVECLPRERFVDLARQAAHADGADPALAVECGEPAEEEREERVEALALDRVVAHLHRQLSRRTSVASRGGVRLPLRAQARVRCRAVYRGRRDKLAVRIRDENGDTA